jgi:hypothetical protein
MNTTFTTVYSDLNPQEAEIDFPDIEPAFIAEIERQQTKRFYDFYQHRIPQMRQSTFQAGHLHKRDMPPEPKNYRGLKGHKFEKEFRAAMQSHVDEHVKQFKLRTTVDKKEILRHQILNCQIFLYKTDKYRRLQKYKARLVVLKNQQKKI